MISFLTFTNQHWNVHPNKFNKEKRKRINVEKEEVIPLLSTDGVTVEVENPMEHKNKTNKF